jgi:hypothetical protein
MHSCTSSGTVADFFYFIFVFIKNYCFCQTFANYGSEVIAEQFSDLVQTILRLDCKAVDHFRGGPQAPRGPSKRLGPPHPMAQGRTHHGEAPSLPQDGRATTAVHSWRVLIIIYTNKMYMRHSRI